MKNVTLRQILTQALIGQKIKVFDVKDGLDAQAKPVKLVSLKPSDNATVAKIEKVTFDRVMNLTTLIVSLSSPKASATIVLTADEKFILEDE